MKSAKEIRKKVVQVRDNFVSHKRILKSGHIVYLFDRLLEWIDEDEDFQSDRIDDFVKGGSPKKKVNGNER